METDANKKESDSKQNTNHQSKNQTTDKQTMNNNNSQNNSTNSQAGGMNVPDWVMHLLTGAGSMGGSYLLFIKPLQEKFDDLQKQITEQQDTIDDLQTQLKRLNGKQGNKSLSGIKKEFSDGYYSDYVRNKKQQVSDDNEEEDDDDNDEEENKQTKKPQRDYGLFSLKNKPSFKNQSSNKGNVRF